MNNYPIWWDTTITLYNKFINPETGVVTWYRTKLDNCFWLDRSQQAKLGEVYLDSHNIICRIPENARFKEKFEWVTVPNNEKDQYFTLSPGDIIIKGNINIDIDEYAQGRRSSDLLTNTQDRGNMTVDNFNINIGPGRGLPHYHITGV